MLYERQKQTGEQFNGKLPVFDHEFIKAIEKHPELARITTAIRQVHHQRPLTSGEAYALFSFAVWSDNPDALSTVSQLTGFSGEQLEKQVNHVINEMTDVWDMVDPLLNDEEEEKGGFVDPLFPIRDAQFDKIEAGNQTIDLYVNRRNPEIVGFEFDVEMLRNQGYSNRQIAEELKVPPSQVRDAAYRLILAHRIKPIIQHAPSTEIEQRDTQIKALLAQHQNPPEIMDKLHITHTQYSQSRRRLLSRGLYSPQSLSSDEQDRYRQMTVDMKANNQSARAIVEAILADFVNANDPKRGINLTELVDIVGVSKQRISFVYKKIEEIQSVPPLRMYRKK